MKKKLCILISTNVVMLPALVWGQPMQPSAGRDPVIDTALASAPLTAQATPPPLTAQAAGPSMAETTAHHEDDSLQEIVVTAQRRAQTLTSVPLSISATTGPELLAIGIDNLSDVRFNTPGFIAESGTGYTQIYIRGIGNGVFVGADPSVATFVDDVPRLYGSLIDDLVNVERVEVLKGAQGGLYGRNSSGGVINIVTRQPSDTFATDVRLTGGQYSTFDGSAYVNLPLSEVAAWNLSVTRDSHEPTERNLAYYMPYTGPNAAPFNASAIPGKLNNQDVWSFDSKLLLRPVDDFKITFQGDYTDKHDAGANGWLNTTPTLTYDTYAYLASLYGLTPVPKWPAANINENDAYGAIPNKSWTKDYGESATAVLALTGVDLTSISAFRGNDSIFEGDIGASPVPIAGFETDFRRHFFYQEFRAVSNDNGPLHWVGGVTYLHDHIDALINGETLGIFGTPTVSHTGTTNYSVYGQLAYDFTDRLTLLGSVRYANEEKKVSFPPTPTLGAIADSTRVDKVIPAATLSYKVGDAGTLYARYANGFKTGGPNPLVRPDRLPPDQQTGLILKPEDVNTYEVGYRSELFDRTVQFTSALFYNQFKNVQSTTSGTVGNTDISNALINVGNAKTYGAETSVDWRVAPPVTLSANVGYLHARYTNANFPGDAYLLGVDPGNGQMPNAPRWQGGGGVKYDQPISAKLRFQTDLLYSYTSRYSFVPVATPTTSQGSFSLVNLRVGVTTVDDRISVSVFARNLFDKHYYVFGDTSGIGDFETPADPRIIGGTVEFKY